MAHALLAAVLVLCAIGLAGAQPLPSIPRVRTWVSQNTSCVLGPLPLTITVSDESLRAHALRNGWLVSQSEDPALTPVNYRGAISTLTNEGMVIPVMPEPSS